MSISEAYHYWAKAHLFVSLLHMSHMSTWESTSLKVKLKILHVSLLVLLVESVKTLKWWLQPIFTARDQEQPWIVEYLSRQSTNSNQSTSQRSSNHDYHSAAAIHQPIGREMMHTIDQNRVLPDLHGNIVFPKMQKRHMLAKFRRNVSTFYSMTIIYYNYIFLSTSFRRYLTLH